MSHLEHAEYRQLPSSSQDSNPGHFGPFDDYVKGTLRSKSPFSVSSMVPTPTSTAKRRSTYTSHDIDPKMSNLANQRTKQARVSLDAIDRYTDLLNEVIGELPGLCGPGETTAKFGAHSHAVRTSQFGATEWSAKEKNALYATLTRSGIARVDLVAKAADKSVPEVLFFWKALRQSYKQQAAVTPRLVKHEDESDTELGLSDEVPNKLSSGEDAAKQIGVDCEARLEDLAERLAARDWSRDCKLEKNRWGKYWLVDFDIANQLNDAVAVHSQLGTRRRGQSSTYMDSDASNAVAEMVEKSDNGNEKISLDVSTSQSIAVPSDEFHPQLLAAATFLHPDAFLTLSTRLFMNPGHPFLDENWFYHRTALTPKPAMFATAFTDLHNLAMIMIRRLVSATLVQAHSRYRAIGRGSGKDYQAARKITTGDVWAARKVLKWNEQLGRGKHCCVNAAVDKNSNSSWNQYWAALPKRLRLKVYDVNVRRAREWAVSMPSSRTKLGKPLNYEEVERRLLAAGSERERDAFAVGVDDLNDATRVDLTDVIGRKAGSDIDNSSNTDLDRETETNNNDEKYGKRGCSAGSVRLGADNSSLPQRIVSTHRNIHPEVQESTFVRPSSSSPLSSVPLNRTYIHAVLPQAQLNSSHAENYHEEDDIATDCALEHSDLHFSNHEELRLWHLMGLDPPESTLGSHNALVLPVPPSDMAQLTCGKHEQSEKGGKTHWSEVCQYKAEWERYRSVVDRT